MTPRDLPRSLLAAAKRALPREARVLGVVGATRARIMYNFHYELDLSIEEKHGRRSQQRIAVCVQEWHGPDAPESLRYHLLWRAIARSSRHNSTRGGPRGFRLQKDFHYQAKFPCSLNEAPWLAEGRAEARNVSKRSGGRARVATPPRASGKGVTSPAALSLSL